MVQTFLGAPEPVCARPAITKSPQLVWGGLFKLSTRVAMSSLQGHAPRTSLPLPRLPPAEDIPPPSLSASARSRRSTAGRPWRALSLPRGPRLGVPAAALEAQRSGGAIPGAPRGLALPRHGEEQAPPLRAASRGGRGHEGTAPRVSAAAHGPAGRPGDSANVPGTERRKGRWRDAVPGREGERGRRVGSEEWGCVREWKGGTARGKGVVRQQGAIERMK